jgi:hypothetical protein
MYHIAEGAEAVKSLFVRPLQKSYLFGYRISLDIQSVFPENRALPIPPLLDRFAAMYSSERHLFEHKDELGRTSSHGIDES